MPTIDPLSQLEMLRLDSHVVAIAETLLGTGHPAIAEGDEWRLGDGLSLSRKKIGRWWNHIDRVGGEHAYGLIRFIKKFTDKDKSQIRQWARIWLQSHPGFGQPITEEDEKAAEDEEASLREERLAEFLAEAGELGEQGAAYFQSRKLDPAKAEAAGARWIRPNIVRVGDAARVAPQFYRGRQIGSELKMLDAVSLAKSQLMPPRYRHQTEKPDKGEPVTFTDIPTPAAIASRYPGQPILVCEGFEDKLSLEIVYPDRLVIGVAGSLGNIGSIPLPRVCHIIVCRDGDLPDSAATRALTQGLDALLARQPQPQVSVTAPPEGQDNNDVLVADGVDGLRSMVDDAKAAEMSLRGVAKMLTLMDRADAMKQRKELARKHGVTKRDLEILEAEARAEAAAEAAALGGRATASLVPKWDETVDLDTALHAGLDVLTKYTVAPREYLALGILWCATCHVVRRYPIVQLVRAVNLKLESSAPGSGKTLTAQALAHFCPFATEVLDTYTVAALRRLFLEAQTEGRPKPTLVLDEIQHNLEGKEELIAWLNGCNRPGLVGTLSVPEGENSWRTAHIDAFGPIIFAGIGESPPELRSRELTIRLQPEAIEDLPEVEVPEIPTDEFLLVQSHLAAWAETQSGTLTDPKIPPWLRGQSGRTARNWLQIYGVALQAGGEWPALVQGAVKLTFGTERENTVLQRLLLGVMAAFDAKKRELEENAQHVSQRANGKDHTADRPAEDGDRLLTSTLLKHLLGDLDEEWRSANKGREITNYWLRSQLRNILQPPGAQDWWSGPEAKRIHFRGYERHQFDDALKRYLPPELRAQGKEQYIPNPSCASCASGAAADNSRVSQRNSEENQDVSDAPDAAHDGTQNGVHHVQPTEDDNFNDFNWLAEENRSDTRETSPDAPDAQDAHDEKHTHRSFSAPLDGEWPEFLAAVQETLAEHPNWSAKRIARELGQPEARIHKLQLPQLKVVKPKRRPKAKADTGPAQDAPVEQPEAGPPEEPASTPEETTA